jgi:coenzyme F420-reducing hydrogenase delta subunit
MQDFEPKIVAFVCNWCTYAGADLTGTSRTKYAANVKIIRFPCTGRIDFMILMKAFENGADGIIVSGCHPNDCHYSTGNFHARRRWIVFRNLLNFTGIETERIQFSWVSAAEGFKWADVVNNTVEKIKAMGPNEMYRKIAVSSLFSEEVTGNE